jgi:hypothetical protein
VRTGSDTRIAGRLVAPVRGASFAAPITEVSTTMKKATATRLLSMTLMLLFVSSVAFAQSVQYNFDKQANFPSFKTYSWVVLAGGTKVDDLKDRMIRAAVEAQLAAKGLTKATGEQADLFVAYQAAIDKEKEFSSYSSDFGYGPGWGRGGWYGGGFGSTWTTGQTSTIYVGSLAIDMYASAQKTLVWRGVVTKTLDPKADQEKQEKNLNKALVKLFKNYPPGFGD